VLPSQRPVGFCVMLLVLAVLGYFGLAGYHTSRHFPRGCAGALIAAGAGLAVIVVSEIVGRVQRSRARRV
jgi:hypothetical protein